MLGSVKATIEHQELLAPCDSVVVGVSGGPDSVCLLHLLTRLTGEYDLALHVAHLDHRLRGMEGEEDAEFVRRLAADWGISCTVSASDVQALAEARGMGIEEAARRARYRFLAQVAEGVGAEKIAVGHNADDQSETVLMHLVRGSGLAGLRGMGPKTWIGKTEADPRDGPMFALIRPLLGVPREEILDYCQRHGLETRHDPSNLDTTLLRNQLRHEILPLLEEVSPGFGGRLRQLAELAAADLAILEGILDNAWEEVVLNDSDHAIELDLLGWRESPLSLRRGLLRRAAARLGSLCDLGYSQIENARTLAEAAQVGAQAPLTGGLLVTVGYDRIIIADHEYVPPPPPGWPLLGGDEQVEVVIPGKTELPGVRWRVEAQLLPADEMTLASARANQDEANAYLDADWTGMSLFLRPRRPGDRFQPLGMAGHSVSLADFMVNCRIPSAWRSRVPVLARPAPTPLDDLLDQILWIAGWRLDERARVTEQTRTILRVQFLPGRAGG